MELLEDEGIYLNKLGMLYQKREEKMPGESPVNSEPLSLCTISSSNDLIHISTMLMKPHHHHPVAQMGQMLEFSLGRPGDGSRFSVLPILAPALIRSRGLLSTSSVCVDSAVVFCRRHCLKTSLPCEGATTVGQRLPDLPERRRGSAAPSQPSRRYLGAILQRLLQQELVHGGHGAAARERGTRGGDTRRSRT